MKKLMILSVAALAFTACSNEDLVDNSVDNGGKDGPIGFFMQRSNMTRASKDLQDTKHYNFGVFAYKSSDKVNNIMADYLVGYYDTENGYGTQTGSTFGDPSGNLDGQSYWMYEKMGYAEYNGTYAGQTVNPWTPFASNVDKQYLRYWDKAAASTYFYAYAPYVNGGATNKSVVTYVDGQAVGSSNDTYTLTIPNATIKHGYDKADEYEFMYASAKVDKANYGHDVALHFNRLNAKVNIKFWEDVPGYSVRIINVTNDYSVSAVPSIYVGPGTNNYGYKLGKIYTQNGAKIKFNDGAYSEMKQYEGVTTSEPLNFIAPADAQIGESRLTATPSTTTYYAIPKGSDAAVLKNDATQYGEDGTLNADLKVTGLTFHVSYELISTTGEVITVKDATVHVPVDYTNWVANTHYTYIFKITKNSNGTTDSADTPNPTDPEVPTELGLYPIVFDNCTVEEWKTSETEHNITDGTSLAYHDVQLSAYSVKSGSPATLTVTVTNNDTFDGAAIDYANVTVTGPDASVGSWYSGSGTTPGTITVPATAAAGVYTVTYTCDPSGLQYNNHPATWTETFLVENAYTITTNLPAVGTHASAATALRIIATMDNGAVTPAAAQLAIEYPDNVDKTKVKVSDDGKKIEVAQDATPGQYKLVYTITVDNAKVKVAEKLFDVVDYQPALTHAVVYLEGSSVVVKLGRTGGDESMWVDNDFCTNHATLCDGAGAKITCGTSGSDMTITVANDTPEGVRTVYYVVNQSDADSKAQYQCMFNVQNTYTVALSKNTLNTTIGAANSAEYGSDFIEITSKSNGVADAKDATTAAKYAIPALDAANYKIFVDGGIVKLQVKKSVPAGNYTVVYTGQTSTDTKTAKATFVIQN